MPTTPFADYQVALMQAQRAQNLANSLRQQSFQPVESYDSGVLKAPISYTQGLAKMLQAYAANKGEERAIQNMGQAYGMQGKMLEGMFGGPQAGGSTISSGPPMQMAQNPQTPNPTPEQYGQNITNSAMTGQPSANEPQVTQPQLAQLTPQGTPGLRLPPGQTPSSMANMMMFSPQIAGQVIGAYNKPDDTTLRLMNMGIDPMSPYGQQVQRSIIQKEGYIAPLNLRPGNIPGDPYTGMPLPSAPYIGAAQATNAAMIERAKQSNTPITVQGPQGQPITGWAGTVLGGGAGQPRPTPQAIPVPQTGPTGTGQTPLTQVPNYGPGIQGQTTVGKEYAGAAAKAGSDYESALNEKATSALTQNKILDDLEQNLMNFGPGKAAAFRKAVAEWKVQTGLADDRDKQIAASGEVGDKLTGQLVSQALRSMSARPSQMEFQIFLQKFVPNMELTAQGVPAVTGFMRQMNNLDLQKQQAFSTQWKPQHTPDQYRDFETVWNKKAAGEPLTSPQSFGASSVPTNRARGSLNRNPDGSFTYVPR